MNNWVKANAARELRVQQVISFADHSGFRPAGWTAERVIGIDEDGTEIKTPPRQRFIQFSTGICMTVGVNLTYFYRVENGETIELASFNTNDINKIMEWLINQKRKRIKA